MTRRPRFTLQTRSAGILLHPTSLPGGHGIGDLGPAAYEFVNFLAAGGLRWWQMLPVNPTSPDGSPYNGTSAFAGNPLLISLDRLVADGLLSARDLRPTNESDPTRVRFAAAWRFKRARLRTAFRSFVTAGGLDTPDFARFCQRETGWLDDYALFAALRRHHAERPWTTWPPPVRKRQRTALRNAAETLPQHVAFECFIQYEFDRQWAALRKYAHQHDVGLIGDIPIFVAHDSSDVWAHPELFDLDARGQARTVSGCPPDCFSRDGQLWRHPQYRWPVHQRTRFAWWLARFTRLFAQFDAVRIDHFLGFNRVWVVPGRARTARRGTWLKTPGQALFSALRRQLGRLEVIAEDLGVVVPEAVALRERFGLPGMRLLHFAFGNDQGDRYNQPHTYPHNCVVYPGTHDNETTAGWFTHLRKQPRQRGTLTAYQRALRYLGTDGRDIHWDIIRLALLSPANTAIIPAQDLLGLGNEARMNTPATTRGNWQWRLRPRQLTRAIARRLRNLTEAYGRAAPDA